MYAAANAPHSIFGFATPVRKPSTSYHSPYTQALTPSHTNASDASASKAVRFQSQPLPPQTQTQQQQQQPSASSTTLTSTTTPNRSPYHSSAPASASALQTATQSPHRNAVTVPSATPPSGASSAAASGMAGTRALVASAAPRAGVSPVALARRVKWNVGALALLWLVPAFTSRPRDAYWAVLDQIYRHIGGEADEIVDGIVGWMLWALSVVLLFNAIEASVLIHRSSQPQIPSLQQQPYSALATSGKAGAVLGMHSPQVAKSLNFVAASRLKGSPKTRTSNIGPGSPISRSPTQRASPSAGGVGVQGSPTVDYSQFSPSLRRTSSPISASSSTNAFSGAASTRLGTPSSATGVEYGVGVGSSSSPLAAFRARHAGAGRSSPSPSSIRARSVTPSISNFSNDGGAANVDLSFDGVLGDDVDGAETTFLGDESFEVDRALKSLRGSLGGVSSTPAPLR